MELLSDELLVQAYLEAIAQDLSNDFIDLLFNEISRRNLLSLLEDMPTHKY